MPTITAAALEDVIAVSRPIVERIVWCSVASTGDDGVARTRLMHPVWQWDGPAPAALVTARPTPLKIRHFAAHPVVSCFYWDPAHDTVAIDATVEWLDPVARRTAWDTIKAVPPPVGFDPAFVWPTGANAPDCAILRFVAHRVIVIAGGRDGRRWDGPR